MKHMPEMWSDIDTHLNTVPNLKDELDTLMNSVQKNITKSVCKKMEGNSETWMGKK